MENLVVQANNYDDLLSNMSYEEIMTLKEKAKEYEQKVLSKKVVELEDWRIKTAIELDEIILKNKELEDEVLKTKEKIETIEKESNILVVRSDLGNILNNAVKKTAFKFTGKAGSVKHILLYRRYTADIYRVLRERFNVASYGRISVNDFEEAKKIAECWFPKKYLNNKIIKEYQDKLDKGVLREDIKNAFEILMEEIGGDICNLTKNK